MGGWLRYVDEAKITSPHHWRRYIKFISDRMSRQAPIGYVEKHHAWPRSLGGPDSKDNLATLTAREHFIAHWMLWKAVKCPDMVFAFWTMHNVNTIKRSRTYASLKKETAIQLRKLRLGKRLSEETKAKQSASLKGLMVGAKNPQFGKALSVDHKAKVSASLKGLMVGAKNPQFGKPPWENGFAKRSRGLWLKASDFYETWKQDRSLGAMRFSKAVGEEFTTTMENIHRKFKEGWIPSEDDRWLIWKESKS